jgi:MFS family permease
MHQIVANPVDSVRRWWVLAIVVAAQFMFGVDAFIVNVAIPTIAVELRASAAQIEAVIAVYLIGYATLVITGGRLGDIYGTRNTFLAGVLGFTLTSLWCGLAQSGPELILARLAQGATAALMVPQVLATIHVLFVDETRARAFAVYGIVLGLAGAAGFLLGGLLVTMDLAGLGWRAVFFVNVPVGLVIIAAAWRLMPSVPRRPGTRLDIPGALVLFAGLLGLIGPLLFGHELHWAPSVWLAMATGAAVIAGFVRLERRVALRGGMPLIDLALLADAAFMRGLCAVFFFFFANLSFYLVMTLFMQNALHMPPLRAGFYFRTAGAGLRCRIASQRHAVAPSWHAGADRGLRGAGHRSCRAGCNGAGRERVVCIAAGGTACRVRLRPGSGHGAAVQCRAVDRANVERGSRLGHVRHHDANRQCSRRCCDRRGLFRGAIRGIGSHRAARKLRIVRVVGRRLCGLSAMDAPRGQRIEFQHGV